MNERGQLTFASVECISIYRISLLNPLKNVMQGIGVREEVSKSFGHTLCLSVLRHLCIVREAHVYGPRTSTRISGIGM